MRPNNLKMRLKEGKLLIGCLLAYNAPWLGGGSLNGRLRLWWPSISNMSRWTMSRSRI
jgi:hypothetical protein